MNDGKLFPHGFHGLICQRWANARFSGRRSGEIFELHVCYATKKSCL